MFTKLKDMKNTVPVDLSLRFLYLNIFHPKDLVFCAIFQEYSDPTKCLETCVEQQEIKRKYEMEILKDRLQEKC